MRKFFIILVVFLATINTVQAYGISPAKTDVSYEPGTTKTYSFDILNMENQEFNLQLYTIKDLSPFIELKESVINIKEYEKSKKVFFTVSIPEGLEPGEIDASIIVEDRSPQIRIGENFISTKLKIPHKVFLNVPVEGKFVTVSIESETLDDKVRLTANVENKGKEDIQKLKVSFEMYDGAVKVADSQTAEKPLQSSAKEKLTSFIDKTFDEGEYDVVTSVSYDEKSMELVEEIVVGSPRLDVVRIDSYLKEDRINEFTLDLKNAWNKRIDNVFLTAALKRDGKIIDATSPSFDIRSNEVKSASVYLDTRGLEHGAYELELSLNYLGKQDSQKYKVEIIEESDNVKIDAKIENLDSNVIIMALISVIAAVSIVLVLKKR